MLTLSLPKPSSFVYAKAQFGRLDNLRRQTEFNRKSFRNYVLSNAFNLENQHVLVGLLQQLSIDPEWELDYVIQYTMFRSYSLCTTFNITSLSHVGSMTGEGFYREGTAEHWCLIEKDLDYTQVFDPARSTPIVPLYTTRTDHSYKHTLLRQVRPINPPKDLAVIGIDLVELAVGWWWYMHDPANDGTGITAYLSGYPLMNAQLIHNQLATVNVLYEHIVKGKSLTELVHSDSVTFTTINESKLLLEMLTFTVKQLTGNRLIDINHMMSKLTNIYAYPYSPFVRAGKAALFSQTCWAWEPAVMKLYSLYMTIAVKGDYKVTDLTTEITRSHAGRVNNYQRIPEQVFRNHFTALANEIYALAKLNV